jgi:hypothetical protein
MWRFLPIARSICAVLLTIRQQNDPSTMLRLVLAPKNTLPSGIVGGTGSPRKSPKSAAQVFATGTDKLSGAASSWIRKNPAGRGQGGAFQGRLDLS